MKKVITALILMLTFLSFNAYAAPHDSRETYEIEQRNRATDKMTASGVELLKELVQPVVDIGALAIVGGIVGYFMAWKNFNAEKQSQAACTLVGAAMMVSIRTWLPALFEKTPFYDIVLRVFS
jgi:hypothetical protein